MIRLAALDMDGTLFDDNKQVPEDNIRAVKEAAERGVKVVLCSGRDYATLKRELELLGLDKAGQYGVGLNGGTIFQAENGKNLYSARMGETGAKAIIAAARKYGDQISIHLYDADHCYVEKRNLVTEFYERVTGTKLNQVDDLMLLAEKAIKIGIFLASRTAIIPGAGMEEIMAFKQKMSKYKPEDLSDDISAPYLVEYVSKTMNKSTGLAELCARLGIEREEVLAVGDLENDLAMIRWAGIGCCMKNGMDSVKEAADYVTERSNNEAGVAEVLDKFAR